jgi:hypothetical protein
MPGIHHPTEINPFDSLKRINSESRIDLAVRLIHEACEHFESVRERYPDEPAETLARDFQFTLAQQAGAISSALDALGSAPAVSGKPRRRFTNPSGRKAAQGHCQVETVADRVGG